MLIQIILHAKAKAYEFLPSTFAVILTPVAFSIVPKLGLDFEVIMYIAVVSF